MKKLNSFLKTSLLLTTTLGIATGCGTSSDQNVLTVGASPVPHAEILEVAKPILAEQGITLEIEIFTDYVLPNTALQNGDLDANFFQHQPYLDSFNTNNGTNIVSAAPIHFEPLGVYAGKSDNLSTIPENAVFAVPNDVTNEARALQLLESLDIITLAPDKGLEATIHDIVANPYNITFEELEAATIPRVIHDVDFAVINGNYALGAGLADTVLASEDSYSDGAKAFANILAATPDTVDSEAIQALVSALQSDAVKTYINEQYNGLVLPVF